MNKLDILNRDEFVERLIMLVENISDNKVSTCFAINGPWGCGKSFVLDMIQEQLEQIQSTETATDKYFVIRYNCWKFDYYEEPLVAIVASIMSIIEEKTKLFPDCEKKREMLGMFKAVGVTLLSIGSAAFKEKTGMDLQKAFDILRDGKEQGAVAYESEHNYDAYFGFNKVMRELGALIQVLTKDYTIVFLVDELDRCLPEYAIKVLERLHHLTEDQSNIITVISIDKNQLISSVKQIFGFESPEKYLEKFINFEIALDYGTISSAINEKYVEYIALFDKDKFLFDDPIEEFLQEIFKNIDIRMQEQLIKKALLVHKLLYEDKKDYSFMCMEVLLSVMICIYKDTSCFRNVPINTTSFDKIFALSGGRSSPPFASFFKDKFERIRFQHVANMRESGYNYVLPDEAGLYGVLLHTWFWMHTTGKYPIIQCPQNDIYKPILKNYEELKKFAEMIKMIS